MLSDEQRDAEAVIFARVCCPPGKHMLIGFEIWKACAESQADRLRTADELMAEVVSEGYGEHKPGCDVKPEVYPCKCGYDGWRERYKAYLKARETK